MTFWRFTNRIIIIIIIMTTTTTTTTITITNTTTGPLLPTVLFSLTRLLLSVTQGYARYQVRHREPLTITEAGFYHRPDVLPVTQPTVSKH